MNKATNKSLHKGVMNGIDEFNRNPKSMGDAMHKYILEETSKVVNEDTFKLINHQIRKLIDQLIYKTKNGHIPYEVFISVINKEVQGIINECANGMSGYDTMWITKAFPGKGWDDPHKKDVRDVLSDFFDLGRSNILVDAINKGVRKFLDAALSKSIQEETSKCIIEKGGNVDIKVSPEVERSIKEVSKSKHGSLFDSIFNGTWLGSQSDADATMYCILAQLGFSHDRIIDIFVGSKLYQESELFIVNNPFVSIEFLGRLPSSNSDESHLLMPLESVKFDRIDDLVKKGITVVSCWLPNIYLGETIQAWSGKFYIEIDVNFWAKKLKRECDFELYNGDNITLNRIG